MQRRFPQVGSAVKKYPAGACRAPRGAPSRRRPRFTVADARSEAQPTPGGASTARTPKALGAARRVAPSEHGGRTRARWLRALFSAALAVFCAVGCFRFRHSTETVLEVGCGGAK